MDALASGDRSGAGGGCVQNLFLTDPEFQVFFRTMNYVRSSLLATVVALATAPGLNAQTTATTDPVGFMTIDLPVGSDTIVAAPLSKAPVFQGAVTSLNGFVITVANAGLGDLTAAPHY